jgi:hypothetical protein
MSSPGIKPVFCISLVGEDASIIDWDFQIRYLFSACFMRVTAISRGRPTDKRRNERDARDGKDSPHIEAYLNEKKPVPHPL